MSMLPIHDDFSRLQLSPFRSVSGVGATKVQYQTSEDVAGTLQI